MLLVISLRNLFCPLFNNQLPDTTSLVHSIKIPRKNKKLHHIKIKSYSCWFTQTIEIFLPVVLSITYINIKSETHKTKRKDLCTNQLWLLSHSLLRILSCYPWTYFIKQSSRPSNKWTVQFISPCITSRITIEYRREINETPLSTCPAYIRSHYTISSSSAHLNIVQIIVCLASSYNR